MHKLKRIDKETIIISVIFFIISILSLFCIHKYKEILLIERISQNYYSDNAIAFTVQLNSLKSNAVDFISFIKKNINVKNYALFIENQDIMKDIRYVYIKNNYILPPIIKGRAFEDSDYINNEFVALVGCNYEKELYTRNEKEYLYFNGFEYHVVGMLGIRTKSNLDNLCLLNLNTLYIWNHKEYNDRDNFSEIYVIDSDSKLKKPMENLKSDAVKFGFTIDIIDKPKEGIARQFNNYRNVYLLFALSIAVSILGLIIFTYLWQFSKNQLIAVKKMLGYLNYNILISLLLDYCACTTLSYVIGIIVLFVLKSVNMVKLTTNATEMILTYIIAMATGIITILFSTIRTAKTDILKYLR